jgi:hypothetical protein
MPKESYVMALDHTSLVGCGIYRTDTLADPSNGRQRAAAWSKSSESVLVEAGA